MPVDPPARDSTIRRSSMDSPQQRSSDRHNLRSRASGGYDRSVEQSPLHRNQAKASWERKSSSEGGHGIAPNTPGRLKTKGGQGVESVDT